MRRVFVPNLAMRRDFQTRKWVPAIDIAPAAAWGQLVHLTEQNSWAVEHQTRIDEMAKKLKEIDSEDYILAVGDPVLIGAAISIANELIGYARVLLWDRKERSYHLVEVSI